MQVTDATAVAAALVAFSASLALVRVLWHHARTFWLLEGIPGPFALPIVGCFDHSSGTREDTMAKQRKEMQKYKPIMRTWIGPVPTVYLWRAEDIEVILSSKTEVEKHYRYKFIRPWFGNGLLTSGAKKWKEHLKLIVPTFYVTILESFLDVFLEKCQTLVDVLEKTLDKPEGFDVCPYILSFSLDAVCETIMGIQINAQGGTGMEYIKAAHEQAELFGYRTRRPWLLPDFVFALTKAGRRHRKCIKTLHSFTAKVIEERKMRVLKEKREKENQESGVTCAKRRLAFLDLLLEASQDGALLSDEEIREEVDTFMVAGHETSGYTLSYAMFLLGSHPELQTKAVAELDAIFQGSDRPPTMRDLAEMKYLELVIKETLRLFPTVPTIGRQLKNDVQMGKHLIPAGCNVSLQIYHLHRDPAHFPNPQEFNPDNFLPENVQGRHPFAYVPFSAGPRTCVGRKYAMVLEKTALSTLLRRFVVTSLQRPQDLRLVPEIVLQPLDGLRLRLARRPPAPR